MSFTITTSCTNRSIFTSGPAQEAVRRRCLITEKKSGGSAGEVALVISQLSYTSIEFQISSFKPLHLVEDPAAFAENNELLSN